ncbi:MAG TPA: ABC transporter substrate-binding protein [Actinomycetota bacterium]|nr:ABC transporter substrate-binding protein [Actinomycetota bacterium]
MRRARLVVLAAIALLGPACTGGPKPPPVPDLRFARGGTLRVTLFGWMNHEFDGRTDDGKADYTLDPQAEPFPVVWELLRCCLTRTLMSYNGRPTAEGGSIARPDLAAADPTVSADGLTWTFRLRRGIHYAPPLQRVEVTAQDFIRGLERGLSPGHFENDEFPGGFEPINGRFQDLYTIIRGAEEFEHGEADTIAGLEAPDPHTLVIHLTEPHGDLPNRLAMTHTAPIPPNPADPGATFGVADGHERGWGRFLVGTGPYMIEGSDRLDFTKPATQQEPVPGYVPGISMAFVRNPSWTAASDPLRPAYPDRIEFVLDADAEAHDREQADLEAGRIDVAYFTEGGSDPEHERLIPTYQADPELSKRLFIYPADFANWLAMNLAVPPFDDIHVRKAVNFAYDKRAQQQQVEGGHLESDPARHVAWDSLENNLLADYDPYRSADFGGDVAAARAEMRQSRYDRNHDGVCDDPSCGAVRVYFGVPDPSVPKLVKILKRSLDPIGLVPDVKLVSFDQFFDRFNDPSRFGAMTFTGEFKVFPNGSTFFDRFLGSRVGAELSLVGASPEQLQQWGYEVTSVPSITTRYDQCVTKVGDAQAKCWAELDQYLMEDVVPWVPTTVHNRQRLVSGRVVHFTYDQFTTLPALDQLALKPGTAPAPYPTPPDGPVPPIPDGVYRYTITPSDHDRFGDHTDDPQDLAENTGTITITLKDGTWKSVQTGDHKFFAPVNEGTYRGSGNRVTWESTRPFINAIKLPEMAWSFDGHALRFRFLSCGNLNTLEPDNPILCRGFRVNYEAHPWVKVG